MKNYEITEEQIKDIYADGCTYIKEWFPEVFEFKKEKGKWYKCVLERGSLFEDLGNGRARGFFQGEEWTNDWAYPGSENLRLATDTEVLEALTNEAKKRGLVEGAYFIEPENCTAYSSEKRRCVGEIKIWNNINTLYFSGSQSLIFKNGVWATVVKTYTKEEAEKMLNAKII